MSGVFTVTANVTAALIPGGTAPVIVNDVPVIAPTVNPVPVASPGGVVTVASSSTPVRSSIWSTVAGAFPAALSNVRV